MASLRRHLEDQYTDDAVEQQDDAVADSAVDDAVISDDAVNYNDGSAVASIRATNCISFTVEPQDEHFNALAGQSDIPTSFISEESFIFYTYRGTENGNDPNNQGYDGVNFGTTYMVNVMEWVAVFGVAQCDSLANYYKSVFGNLEGIDNIYWGPICHHTSFGITMGIFLDKNCTVYAPGLSKDLQSYLYYNEGGDPDEDLLQTSYATSALNNYYQNDLLCNGDGDGSNSGNVCSAILHYSVNEESCQPVDSSMSHGTTPFTFTSWYTFGDPHRYYHLSQNDMLDVSTMCNAINFAITGRYTFEDLLTTLEQENGDTAKALEQFNNEILSPIEKLMAMVGAVILILIGLYCCFATIRRLRRAHQRSKRQQRHGARGNTDNDSIIYELGRTFTVGSSSDESSTGPSKKEPLIPSGGESTDTTHGGTKYPITNSSCTFQPRLERDGSIVLQDKRMRVIAVVQKEDASTVAVPETLKSNRFLSWMKFRGGENNDESVFDGITINHSQTFDDPFVGIEENPHAKVEHSEEDSLFEGVGTDHEPI
jgi:hypothetical protein